MALPTETAEDAEMKAIRKPGEQETGKRGAGELATQYLQVGRPLLWAPLVRRAEDCPPYLLHAIAALDGQARWMPSKRLISGFVKRP